MVKVEKLGSGYRFNDNPKDITCFLGSPHNTLDSSRSIQESIILELSKYSISNLVCFSPDYMDICIHLSDKVIGKNISYAGLDWELEVLSNIDIFSLYTPKNINAIDTYKYFYYLGRMSLELKGRFPNDYRDRLVVSVEEGCPIEVEIRKLVMSTSSLYIINSDATYESHAKEIFRAYNLVS